MQYTTIYKTEYEIRYVDVNGKIHSCCKVYQSEKNAYNWIDKQSKPSYVKSYIVVPIATTYKKLIPLK
jgi:hypothetical protein